MDSWEHVSLPSESFLSHKLDTRYIHKLPAPVHTDCIKFQNSVYSIMLVWIYDGIYQ
jgi:hypothetical protein